MNISAIRKLSTFAILGLGLGLGMMMTANPAAAYYTESVAWHNGSKMLVINNDGQVTIQYTQPRRAMRNQGVGQGTVLFNGSLHGSNLSGTARVFRRGCTPAEYGVTGQWNVSTGRITLRGPAPRRVRGGCQITGYANSGSNSYLAFNITQAGNPDHIPDPGNVSHAGCGWYIILTCHGNRSAANASLNNLGGPGVGGQAGAKVVHTNQYSGFRNGYYCVADGPYTTKNAASSIAWNEAVPSAYVKKGC